MARAPSSVDPDGDNVPGAVVLEHRAIVQAHHEPCVPPSMVGEVLPVEVHLRVLEGSVEHELHHRVRPAGWNLEVFAVQPDPPWQERSVSVVVWCKAAVDHEVVRDPDCRPAGVIKARVDKWPIPAQRLERRPLSADCGRGRGRAWVRSRSRARRARGILAPADPAGDVVLDPSLSADVTGVPVALEVEVEVPGCAPATLCAARGEASCGVGHTGDCEQPEALCSVPRDRKVIGGAITDSTGSAAADISATVVAGTLRPVGSAGPVAHVLCKVLPDEALRVRAARQPAVLWGPVICVVVPRAPGARGARHILRVRASASGDSRLLESEPPAIVEAYSVLITAGRPLGGTQTSPKMRQTDFNEHIFFKHRVRASARHC